MNCSRFRFLIQQWFDAPLSPQDERMLVAHVDSCDSCARFQHQLDQVVQGTPEVALPDECLPSNLESLAKRIMDSIPQEKGDFLSMLKNMFSFGGKNGGKSDKSSAKAMPARGGSAKGKSGKGKMKQPVITPEHEDSLSGQGMFPHVRRASKAEEAAEAKNAANSARNNASFDEELLATSTRLKSLQNKMQPIMDEPQAQSQGLSLGTKFGVNVPLRDSGGNEDGPLTLAESIRRKMVEDKGQDPQAVSGGENYQQQAGFAEGAPSPFAPPQGGFGQAQPGQGFAPPQPNMGWGEPAQAQPAGAQPGWQDPPRPGVGGDSDWKPAPPGSSPGTDWQSAKPQAPAWGAPPDPQATSGNQTGWQQPAANAGWGSPAPAAAAPQQDWSGGQQAPTAPPSWAPPTAPSQQGWNEQQAAGGAPSGWGQPPAPPQAANSGWGEPAAQAPASAGGSGWGSQPQAPATTNWSDPQASSGSQTNWGQPAPSSAAGWSTGNAAPAATNWGGQPAPAAPAAENWSTSSGGNTQGWGAPPAVGGDQNWGAPPAVGGDQNPATATGGMANQGWAAPPAAQPAPQPQPMQQSQQLPQPGAPDTNWNQQPVAPASGWGGQPTPTQASGWGNGADNNGWAPSPAQEAPANVNPFLTTSAPPPAPEGTPPAGDNMEAWSEEGEQIQTGMWQAFSLGEPEIGQPKAPTQGTGIPLPRPGQPPQNANANRFDTPIQARMGDDNAALAAAAAGKTDPNMFDIPIQERQKMQQQAAAGGAPDGAPRWDMPIQQRAQEQPMAPAAPMAPPPPPAPGAGGIPKNSIMDRLNKVLGDDLAAMAANNNAPGGNWANQQPVAPQFAAPAAPPIPAPQPIAAAAPAAPQGSPQSGLFKLDDSAIDKVFAENLGVNDPSRPVAAQAAPQMAPPVPPMHAPIVEAPMQAPVQPAIPAPQPPVPSLTGAPRITPVPPRQAPEPMPQQPAAAPMAPAAEAPGGGLFKGLDDRAMDQLFASNLGVKDEAAALAARSGAPLPPPVPPMNMAPQAPAPMPQQAPMPQAPVPPMQSGWNQPAPQQQMAPSPAPAPAQNKGLLNVDDDAMDRIFSDLGVKEKASAGSPKINVRDAVNQIRNLADMPAPPTVPGISRLSREEQVSEPTPGKINAIGKFLLDQQDFNKIGRLTEQDLSDTKIRVLTHEASDEINRLLAHIATQPGVIGSVIVGHDGILIANSLPKELDPESTGIWSLGIYINTTNASKKMGHNHLHQLVCRTPDGYLVIADFGGGILVTVSNEQATDKLIPLMRTITHLVAQS